jgi:hypothetical protein
MAQYCYIAVTDSVPGREEEFNTWYEQQHVPDLLRIPGFVAARRFKLVQSQGGLPGRYLALYEIETDDPQGALAELMNRAGTAQMVMSEAFDPGKVAAGLFVALGARRTA